MPGAAVDAPAVRQPAPKVRAGAFRELCCALHGTVIEAVTAGKATRNLHEITTVLRCSDQRFWRAYSGDRDRRVR